MFSLSKYFSIVIAAAALTATTAFACTGIELKATDGSVVNGRTVEFGAQINNTILIIPRNYSFTGTLPDGSKGLAYQAKYAAVGVNMEGQPAIADGMNEAGLSVGAFYFPDYAGYAQVDASNQNKAVSPIEFPNWILTQFATTDEVKAGLANVVIAPTELKAWGFTPPFHYVVYDKSGNSIVIEPLNGKLVVYDNPLGVITNSPTFDWQMTNLQNYINLSPINVPKVEINGVMLKEFGQGSGLHGLPGDFSPPSRFVRAAFFTSAAIPPANAKAAVLQTFHILNQFDIPIGSVRTVENGTVQSDFTMLTSVKDPQSLSYYFKTYDDQDIKVVNLKALDLNAKEIKTINTTGEQSIEDVSKTAK